MKRFVNFLAQGVILASLLGCSTATATATPCAGQAITLGDVDPGNPAQVIADMTPLANYLAEKLEPYGICEGSVEVPDTVEDMSSLIKDGKVDIYFDSMYPAYLVSQATGAQPILRQWRNCDPGYYSVIVARADSGITSIDDLPGHIVAMDNRFSTSGFVLPSARLLERGLKLIVKDTFSAPVAQDEIGIWFSLSDDNSYAAIHTGKVDAAVTDDYRYGNDNDGWKTKSPGELILLADTDYMPRRTVIVRGDLPEALKQAIKGELIGAKLDPNGKEIIEELVGTCEFDDPNQGIEAAFDQMGAWAKLIDGIPGLPPVLPPTQ